jgi:hypothetical protein
MQGRGGQDRGNRGLKAAVIVLVIVLSVIAGGFAFLSTWDIPPPSKPVEKVIPNEKLSR